MAKKRFNSARFASRLRRLRTTQGWTQAQVAELAGMDPTALSHFEAGRRLPGPDNLYKLCTGLNCSADELLGIRGLDQRG